MEKQGKLKIDEKQKQKFQVKMSKTKNFLFKELRLLVTFLSIIFIIEVVPEAFSFNQKSDLFLEYYENALPISFAAFLLILYAARLLIVTAIFLLKRRFKAPA